MDLYDRSGLNDSSGRIAIQARVQNQAISRLIKRSVLGLTWLTKGGTVWPRLEFRTSTWACFSRSIDGPITAEWISANISADRTVEFGSEDYFTLAGDPAARPFLQSGSNVVFSYQGQVIAVADSEGGYQAAGAGQTSHQPSSPDYPSPGRSSTAADPGVTLARLALLAAVLLLGLAAVLTLFGVGVVAIYRAQRGQN